ncbi:hypothetical protein EV122DRAFT_279409 [Schizophyllum commune]
MPSVSTQPSAVSIMDVTGKAEYEPLSQDEKHEHECCNDASASQAGPHHKRCHNNRLKRMLVPLLVSIASIIGVMALGCFASMLLGGGHHDMSHLMSRQTTGESDSGSTFTDHKYYLIVIFVGLVVVIILGIMLSAWCCKESPLLPVLLVRLLWRLGVLGMHRMRPMRRRIRRDGLSCLIMDTVL